MDKKVWDILQKDKWTKEGQKELEDLFNAINSICDVARHKDMVILCKGIDEHLYEVMDILDEFVSK
jgi:hypothetical protein